MLMLRIVGCYWLLLGLLPPQYPGWSQMDDGSIRVAEVTEDSLGTYTCMPYNALGSMGWSPPAPLVLKVLPRPPRMSVSSEWLCTHLFGLLTPGQDPPKFSVVPGGEYRQEAGRELVIPCEAEGDPFPNITWRKVRPSLLSNPTGCIYNLDALFFRARLLFLLLH